MSKPAIKGVLFDLDGTLADTAPDLVYALNLGMADAGYPSCSLETVKHAATHGSLALVKAALPDIDDDEQKQLQQALLHHYRLINGDRSCLFEHLAELLTYFDNHNMPYGIVTNKHACFARPLVQKLGLMSRIKTLISGDSTLHPKPHSAPMLLAAQQMNLCPESILYLGDAERDLIAAQNANMIGGIAHWGYLSPQDKPHLWPGQLHFNTTRCLHDYFVLNDNLA
ncbi:HAD family hydrolase [Shewanella sp. OMA3-2]|uniref:HAD family hydrolase n=1 Tax=Shewanella sp. OMA3-2 TaxID=2908650 RepID=UPI001F44B7F4|nr:HAD-IA family hydrolase [Shewanella sp. OMA3-2]UJF20681.1 HAD-IA family hydrolase [Shewanella sp. OMA3-2]